MVGKSSRRTSRARGLPWFALLGLLLGACGTDPAARVSDAGTNDAGTNDAGTSDAGTSDAGTNDAGTPDAGSCSPAATYGGGESSAPGGSVTATVVDTTGAPAASQPIYICGLNLCSDPATTNAQGMVTLSTSLNMKGRAFKFGDSVDYAEFAIPLTASSTNFGTLTTAHLPSTGGALTPGTTAVSGDVSLAVPAGATVGINNLVYTNANQQALRTQAIPVASAQAQLASAPNASTFKLLYGVAPAETTICPPAKVTVSLPHVTTSPNDLGWAPNAAVEFWVTTVDTAQTFAPYAGWAHLSDGTVSADGTTVSTSTGQGFPYLSSFAVRLK